MTESDLLSSSNSVSSDPDMDSIWTAELERVEDAPDALEVNPPGPALNEAAGLGCREREAL